MLTLALDVDSGASIQAAFDAAVAKFGRVDVVVNNAGYGIMGDAESFIGSAVDMAKARANVGTSLWSRCSPIYSHVLSCDS